jgi:purine-binding chemotaxis protein CheW
MNESSYLTFRVSDRLYGISITYVEEMFSLPEFTQGAEASQGLVGTVNLRGDILPILDLNASLEHRPLEYRLTDSIVTLKQDHSRVGLIVNQVYGVKGIASQEITTELLYNQPLSEAEQLLIAGVAFGEEIYILHAPEKWYSLLQIPEFLPVQAVDFCPTATAEERAILRQRAENLNQSIELESSEESRYLALIGLNPELFGVDLTIVREFIDVHQVTPIPCCPSYFVGNMNLRGGILTLVDIHELLNLPLKPFSSPSRVMVVEIDSMTTGIIVDEVQDAMFLLNPRDITTVSATLSINSEYLQAMIFHQERAIYILDLPKILDSISESRR